MSAKKTARKGDTGKKTEKWETLDLTDDEPASIQVSFDAVVRFGDKTFKAGGTHLDVLTMRNVPYVGVVVEQDGKVVAKHMEVDEHIYKFMVTQGLPIVAAKALASLAAALRDERS